MRSSWRPTVDQSRLLLRLSRDVTSTLDLQEVLDASFVALRELVDFDGGAIALIDDSALRLAATDPQATPEALQVRLPLGQGITGTIAVTGDPEYIPDIERDERVYPEGKKRATSPGVRSWFGAPLIMHGDPIGVISIDAKEADAFSESARALVLAFVPTIAAAVQNAQLYEREIEAVTELREAERLKNDFLSVISHELRTPLTAVTGFADTLSRRAEILDRDMVVELSTRIADAAHRLERLIEDVLNISQIERGSLHVELTATAVWPIVRQTVLEVGGESHIITMNVSPDLPPVLADAGRLYQVLANLLVNARKFSPPGSVIEIEARRQGDRVALSVRDRGRGIAPEAVGKIFDRFYQVEPATTRGIGGLGIGLYLVKQLSERMHATVSVSSVPGAGSTFTVLLQPVMTVQLDRAATAASRVP